MTETEPFPTHSDNCTPLRSFFVSIGLFPSSSNMTGCPSSTVLTHCEPAQPSRRLCSACPCSHVFIGQACVTNGRWGPVTGPEQNLMSFSRYRIKLADRVQSRYPEGAIQDENMEHLPSLPQTRGRGMYASHALSRLEANCAFSLSGKRGAVHVIRPYVGPYLRAPSPVRTAQHHPTAVAHPPLCCSSDSTRLDSPSALSSLVPLAASLLATPGVDFRAAVGSGIHPRPSVDPKLPRLTRPLDRNLEAYPCWKHPLRFRLFPTY